MAQQTELCPLCGHFEEGHVVLQGNLTNFYEVCGADGCTCQADVNRNGPHPRSMTPFYFERPETP